MSPSHVLPLTPLSRRPNGPEQVGSLSVDQLPSPEVFYRLRAPTIDAQRRSEQCRNHIDKECGLLNECDAECQERCVRNSQTFDMQFYCNDQG